MSKQGLRPEPSFRKRLVALKGQDWKHAALCFQVVCECGDFLWLALTPTQENKWAEDLLEMIAILNDEQRSQCIDFIKNHDKCGEELGLEITAISPEHRA